MGHKRKVTKLVNLTPHEVCIYDRFKEGLLLPPIEPSGTVARVERAIQPMGTIETIDGVEIPIQREFPDAIVGLPERPNKNWLYIVSKTVLEAVKRDGELFEIWKDNLVAPDTGEGSVVRDENGRILGVRAFLRG